MRTDGDYISREAAIDDICSRLNWSDLEGNPIPQKDIRAYVADLVNHVPAADVVDEGNVLKFYYVRSTDDYWIGQRVDNFYYAEFDPKALQWTWTHSRYLPWGEHVVSPTSLWKENTYPSKPEEMPFEEWLRGLIKKYFTAADVRPVERAHWTDRRTIEHDGEWYCSACGKEITIYMGADRPDRYRFCPNCGCAMEGTE